MRFLVSDVGCGFEMERIPGEYGGTRTKWSLCWDADHARPVMVPSEGTPWTEVLAEDAQEDLFGWEVVDTTSEELVAWGCSRWGSTYWAHPFREVTVDGVTWQILLDGIGYPWITQRKEAAR